MAFDLLPSTSRARLLSVGFVGFALVLFWGVMLGLARIEYPP